MEGSGDGHNQEEGPASREMTLALLALDPQGTYVVLAVGTELRIFHFSRNTPVTATDDTSPPFHAHAITCIAFDKKGSLFASSGDDKLVKLWSTDTWRCTRTLCASKKVSAVAFSNDSKWLLFADKFGVVYVMSTIQAEGSVNQPVQFLAHCCSIITGLECSPDGRFVITSDRDFKIRVSVFPQNPVTGAHEIQIFCLGHTNFVSCFTFVGKDSSCRLLISGGGDGTVRLWDYELGSLLDTFHSGEMVDMGMRNDESDVDMAITGISVSANDSIVAVTVESLDGVLCLRCDLQLRALIFLQKVILPEQFSPTCIGFDIDDHLWLVMGGCEKDQTKGHLVETKVPNLTRAVSTYVKMYLVEFRMSNNEMDYCLICPGDETLRILEGDVPDSTKAFSVAEAAKMSVKNHLLKHQYSQEHRDHRKQTRNDKKFCRRF